MIQNVTIQLNEILATDDMIRRALKIISACELFGRETKSAALGEISEHVVARMVGGSRCDNGNKGFDVIDATGLKIEVKSRMPGIWGDGLMFDFRRHTQNAEKVFCICWSARADDFSIAEAYCVQVKELISRWGTPGQQKFCARTTLKKLRSDCYI
jgi:hypothetical protein